MANSDKNKLYLFVRKNFFKLINFFQNIRAFIIKYQKPNALVLMYHRVDNVGKDPVFLNVSPENFKEQINWLKQNRDLVSLREITSRIKNKKLIGNEVAITFDDGYLDVFKNAVPLLEEFQSPATFFITTQNLGDHEKYEWDKEYNDPKYIDTETLKKVAANDLFEIGAHTETHRKLSRLSKCEQAQEIIDSKQKLEEILHKKINSFAYPFGGKFDFNKKSVEIVSKNFDCGCAGFEEAVTNDSSTLKIPRIIVRDEKLEFFKKRLSKYTVIGQ